MLEFVNDYTGNERTTQRERETEREREREMPNVYIIFLLNFWLKAEMCIDGMIFFEA